MGDIHESFCAALPSAQLIIRYWADYAGRWEISGRQFGMHPPSSPSHGRLEIKAGGTGYHDLQCADFRRQRTEGRAASGCTEILAAASCGALVLKRPRQTHGGGTIAGEHRHCRRAAAKPAGYAHEFVPKPSIRFQQRPRRPAHLSRRQRAYRDRRQSRL
jgi:hypothetical protein